MVAWARGYFGTPFKGYHGVTQWEPISPTISNVVVDEVLQHWFTVVSSTEEAVDPGTAYIEGFGSYFQHLTAYFYADDVLNDSNLVTRLQRAFTTLTELFDHVVLCTNVANAVSMDCKTCHTLGVQSIYAHGGLRPQDDGGGTHLPETALPAGPLPQVQCRPCRGVLDLP